MEKKIIIIAVTLIFLVGLYFVSAVQVDSAYSFDILETASASTLQHNLLENLAWSVAGHIMDTELDMNDNNITEVDTYCINADCSAKMYHNGTGVIIKA
tara:strand:- start:589 stop:885 length:297 start_codon:yes stop_codon:yes gene_type:complete